MELFRKVIDSDSLDEHFDIPVAWRHRKIEIILLPSSQGTKHAKRIRSRFMRKSLLGSLRKYANPVLRKNEKNAWLEIAGQKHANR